MLLYFNRQRIVQNEDEQIYQLAMLLYGKKHTLSEPIEISYLGLVRVLIYNW